MHGPFATTRLAVSLRRLRSRFGIAAPRVAVRPHVPWYLLALRSIIVLGLALAFASWMYDVGRRFAGFDSHESEQELTTLRAKLEAAEEELAHLRKLANGSQSSLEIERTAQKQMSEQAKTLEAENSKLKEEVAVLENLLAGGGKGTTPGVARLNVEAVGGGIYRFHLLLTSGSGRNDQPIDGNLQVSVTMIQAGKPVMLTFPSAADRDLPRYRVSFRRFIRQDGTFQVPADAKVQDVEAKLLVSGSVVATRKITL